MPILSDCTARLREVRPIALLNSNRRQSVETIGDEANPIILIDDAFADPMGARTAAQKVRFGKIGPFYPGIRAPLAPAFSAALYAELSDILEELYGHEAKGLVGESFFSLVTTPPSELMPIQRLPHYDGIGRDQFAAIAYMSEDDLGGTAFFRHRATGFETVDQTRFEPFKAALEADVSKHGLPPMEYMLSGEPLFDRIAVYPPRFNRLLFYRGIQLHSGSITAPDKLSSDPARGRLTITSFFKKPN